jgi:hypothetical protein
VMVSETNANYPHQRTQARTAHRNGHRPLTVSTTAGDLASRKVRHLGRLPASFEGWAPGNMGYSGQEMPET